MIQDLLCKLGIHRLTDYRPMLQVKATWYSNVLVATSKHRQDCLSCEFKKISYETKVKVKSVDIHV